MVIKKETSQRQKIFLDWVIDILLYTAILTAFSEYVSAIHISTFYITLLTAFVLKALLVIIIRFEHRVNDWFKSKNNKLVNIVGTIVTLGILFFSKFLIIEIINFIFVDEVVIKGFVPLALMVIVMIATRKVLEKIYRSL
jgi:hypothetical protein